MITEEYTALHKSAFTIVEILVAITIIGIALLPVFATMSNYLKAEAKNDLKRIALQAAVSVAEEMLASDSARDSSDEIIYNDKKYFVVIKVLDGDCLDEPEQGTNPLEIHVRLYDKNQKLLVELLSLK